MCSSQHYILSLQAVSSIWKIYFASSSDCVTSINSGNPSWGRGGGGWGWGGNRGNFGTDVRASISKTYPIHMPGLRKNGPIHILDHPNCWPIHILPFDFLYPFFAGYYTNIMVNSCNTKRISSLEKSLSEKYVHIPGCQKNEAFHKGIQKNRVIRILFVGKRGPIIYLAALKKRAIRHAHRYYAINRKLPLHTPPPAPVGNPLVAKNPIIPFFSF